MESMQVFYLQCGWGWSMCCMEIMTLNEWLPSLLFLCCRSTHELHIRADLPPDGWLDSPPFLVISKPSVRETLDSQIQDWYHSQLYSQESDLSYHLQAACAHFYTLTAMQYLVLALNILWMMGGGQKSIPFHFSLFMKQWRIILSWLQDVLLSPEHWFRHWTEVKGW